MKKRILHLILYTFILPFIGLSQGGELDASFGTDGIVITNANTLNNGYSLTTQTDGKIILGGSTGADFFTITSTLIRYNIDGSLDETFGDSGILVESLGMETSQWQDVLIQDDGNIVAIGGSQDLDGRYNTLLARFKENGELDISFGEDGIVILELDSIVVMDTGSSVVLQSDGKIVVLIKANFEYAYEYIALARFNIDGSLDNTFGIDGIVSPIFGADTIVDIFYLDSEIVIDEEDNLYIGYTTNYIEGAQSDYALTKYNADGILDTDFSEDGRVVVDISTDLVGGTSSLDQIKGVSIANDGNITIAGITQGSEVYFTFVKIKPDGTLDDSYGEEGVVVHERTSDVGFETILFQEDNKLLIAGRKFSSSLGYNNFLLERYTVNGDLDITFGIGGKITTELSDEYNIALNIVITPTGKILCAGQVNIDVEFNFGLAQYHAESPDASINESRKEISSITLFPNPATDVINVTYSLNESTLVTVEIKDNSGRRIATLIENQERESGIQSEYLELNNLAKGLYHVSIQTDAGISVRSLIIQ